MLTLTIAIIVSLISALLFLSAVLLVWTPRSRKTVRTVFVEFLIVLGLLAWMIFANPLI